MKRLISAMLAVMLLSLPFFVPTASASKESEYKQKLSDLAEKEAEYQKQLDEAESDISDKEAYSDTLVGQIETLNEEISVYSSQISALNDDIADKQAVIDKANADVADQMKMLRKRLVAIYEAGETSDLEIILGAKDFSDFLDKVELVRTLTESDKKLINKIQKRLDKVSGEQQQLVDDRAELEESEEQLETKQEKLNTLLAENKAVLAELYQAKSDAKSLLADAQAEEDEIQSQLDAYYAAQNAKKNKSSGGSGGSGGSGSSDTPINISGSGYTWPTPGCYAVGSPFGEDRGYSHKGIDILAGMGDTIVAAESGTVIASNNTCTHNWGKDGSCGCGGGFGNYVMIDHGNGYSTTYGHMTSTAVSTGQTVSKGQVIGYVGSTGWSSGTHLHYETRLNGVAYDPMSEY